MKRDLNWKGHVSMLGANMCWGLMSPVAKLVFASGIIAPIIMVDFRIAGAALLFWITSLFTDREHVPSIDKLRLFGAGMIGILLNQGCFIIGGELYLAGRSLARHNNHANVGDAAGVAFS